MSSFNLKSFLVGKNLVTKDGEVTISGDDYFSGKVLGLYFSASWCGPCRSFTPKLSAKYRELTEAGKNFEIIFVSAD